jgi:hypothetical protein
VVIQLGVVASRLIGLRWRSGNGCSTEQLYLIAIGIELRLDFAQAPATSERMCCNSSRSRLSSV